jgi:hypothetical protein
MIAPLKKTATRPWEETINLRGMAKKVDPAMTRRLAARYG